MIAIGFLFGALSIVSVFLPWEAYVGTDYLFLSRISKFLGITNESYDNLFGLDFLPILCTLIYMLCFLFAKKHIAVRALGIVSSSICFVIGTYNILKEILSGNKTDYIPGVGLWIFTIASLCALIIAVLIIAKKGLLEKKMFLKFFD